MVISEIVCLCTCLSTWKYGQWPSRFENKRPYLNAYLFLVLYTYPSTYNALTEKISLYTSLSDQDHRELTRLNSGPHLTSSFFFIVGCTVYVSQLLVCELAMFIFCLWPWQTSKSTSVGRVYRATCISTIGRFVLYIHTCIRSIG